MRFPIFYSLRFPPKYASYWRLYLTEVPVFPSPPVVTNGWCHPVDDDQCGFEANLVSTWHQQVSRKWQVSVSWLVLVVIQLDIWWRTLFLLIDSPLQELLINLFLIPSICFPAPSQKHISRPEGVMKSHGINAWRLNFEFQSALSSNRSSEFKLWKDPQSFWFCISEENRFFYHSTYGLANFESIVSFREVLTVKLYINNKDICLASLAADKLLETFLTSTPMKTVTHHWPLHWLEA